MNKKNISIIALIVILVGGAAFYFLRGKESEVTYIETPARKMTLTLKVSSTGTVSPQNRLEIKPPVAGRIEEVLVKEGDVVKKGTIIAWISSSERAALLDAVRAQGANELKKWESLYRPTPVIAPIQGTVILRSVEEGQSFTNTESIFTMADRLTVKAQVDETDIAQIKIGQMATIKLDAYQDNPVSGKVVHLAYDATITNNVTSYIVDVLPDNVPDFMRSGMTSTVEIQVASKENVIALPMTAIITDKQGSSVKVRQGKEIKQIPVTTGVDDGKMIEITSGLMENEIVLTEDTAKTFGGKKNGSPFMPTGPKGGRGGGGGGRR